MDGNNKKCKQVFNKLINSSKLNTRSTPPKPLFFQLQLHTSYPILSKSAKRNPSSLSMIDQSLEREIYSKPRRISKRRLKKQQPTVPHLPRLGLLSICTRRHCSSVLSPGSTACSLARGCAPAKGE